MQRNIFAYTAPGADFPEYVSINEHNGKIVLTARSKGATNLVDLDLPRGELLKLLDALRSELTPPMMKAHGESI